MEMILNEEDNKFLTELSNKMMTQNRRITADPFYYVIECEEDVPAAEGCQEFTIWYDGDQCAEYSSEEEIKEHCLDSEYDEEKEQEFRDRLREIPMRVEKVYKGFFLTEEACEEHIRLNHYHYKNPRSYVEYGWRNPEMAQLFKIIKKFATVEDTTREKK